MMCLKHLTPFESNEHARGLVEHDEDRFEADGAL
jgi:hypothetical protein